MVIAQHSLLEMALLASSVRFAVWILGVEKTRSAEDIGKSPILLSQLFVGQTFFTSHGNAGATASKLTGRLMAFANIVTQRVSALSRRRCRSGPMFTDLNIHVKSCHEACTQLGSSFLDLGQDSS